MIIIGQLEDNNDGRYRRMGCGCNQATHGHQSIGARPGGYIRKEPVDKAAEKNTGHGAKKKRGCKNPA